MTENPEYEGLTEGELFGYAALEAMEDAGITPKDVDYFFHGSAMPLQTTDYITPNVQVKDWFGMGNKASSHHSEACCTGYVALDQGCMAVASGKYDVVLTGCVEMGNSLPVPGMPAQFRQEWGFAEFIKVCYNLCDRAYTRELIGMGMGFNDSTLHEYAMAYDFTDAEIDKALCACAIANRTNASVNPKALHHRLFDDIAKENGFANAFDYLMSPFNPLLTRYMRLSSMVERAEGASACIIVPTDMVREYTKQQPVEVVGIGHSVVDVRVPNNERVGTERAVQQVYDSTGVRPEEIDLLMTIDFFLNSTLLSPEWVGYIPKGKCAEYTIDGRTTYLGDKPINTNGGCTSFGHAHAATGIGNVYEAVKQMRGEAGERQLKNTPATTLIRGYGGAQNMIASILRTLA
jgi:acetyl-CoA C-acetyltransferase